MIRRPRSGRRGFTLVEIMIAVTIIALLAAIAVPNFMRARQRSQAARILDDLHVLNDAVDQYALDNNKNEGERYGWLDIRAYVKAGTQLYSAFPTNGRSPPDLLGNRYHSTRIIDEPPAGCEDVSLNPSTYAVLSDVTPPDYWSPFGVY